MNGKGLNDREKQLIYIHGYIAAKIEGFAQSGELSAAEITDRLGALLVGEEVREVLGVPDRVLDVRVPTAEGAEGERGEMASHVRARVKKPRTSSAHGKGVKPNSFWQSLTPAERTAENKRRALKRKDRVVKGKKVVAKGKKKKGYWDGLTKEQRHVEMVKRQKVRKEKAARKLAAEQSEEQLARREKAARKLAEQSEEQLAS